MFSLVWGLELLLNGKIWKLFHKPMNHQMQYMAGETLTLQHSERAQPLASGLGHHAALSHTLLLKLMHFYAFQSLLMKPVIRAFCCSMYIPFFN